MNRFHFAVAALFLAVGLAHADNWPHWRGPTYNGISQEKGLPLYWSETKNLAWKLPLPGRGGSTPVVWGDRIFLTSGDGKDLALLCVGTDGKLLWKRKLGTPERLFIKGDEANESSASPSTDGKHVFAFVGSGEFACFDFDGNEVWKFNVQERYGKFKIQHGLHTTPLLYEDRLYLSLLHSNGHWVVALDKASGKEIWKVARPSDAESESKESYASPCLWRGGKEPAVVILGADYATAHSLKDGKELWRLGDLNPKTKYNFAFRIISTPVAGKDLLIVPTARNTVVVALKPGAEGMIRAGDPAEAWRKTVGSPDVPSPFIHEGLVYLCRENGVLSCLDAYTGKELYQERLHEARYRASPVYADGKILCSARDGTFTVLKPGRKAEVLAVNSLDDAFTASPAIAHGRIYLRGFGNLYAIEEKGK